MRESVEDARDDLRRRGVVQMAGQKVLQDAPKVEFFAERYERVNPERIT